MTASSLSFICQSRVAFFIFILRDIFLAVSSVNSRFSRLSSVVFIYVNKFISGLHYPSVDRIFLHPMHPFKFFHQDFSQLFSIMREQNVMSFCFSDASVVFPLLVVNDAFL